ncbi:Major facilitator superfamily protein [Perilla frutescens var. frutescens]|nr:Major facilitator superfamily protein [Perilla frutescens var. frutescens]
MFLSCAIFFVGTRIYVMILPQGSPITNVVRTLVVAFKKRKMELPQQPYNSLFNYHSPVSINSKLAYTDQLRWLNKASIITAGDEINEDGSAADPWNLCSVQQVEEIKCVTYLVLQALQSDRRLGRGSFKIPAATYYVFSMISLTVWIPVYDRILVPLLRRITQREEGITMLQRIGIGLVLAILTMLVAAVVENHRRTLALTHPTIGMVPHKGAVSSMSGNWLIPQLGLVGISEAFALIGQVEFYYKQFPENMRSFAGSFLFCGFAISSYFTSFLVSVVHNTSRIGDLSNWLAEDLNKGRLDYFYYFVAGLEMVNLAYFLVCAKWYRYKTIYDDDSSKMDVAVEMIDSQKSV